MSPCVRVVATIQKKQKQKKKSEQEITKEVENTEISVIKSTVAISYKEDNTEVEIIAADNETNSTASKTAAVAVKSSTEGGKQNH